MDENVSTDESQPTISYVPGLESMRVVQIAQFLPRHERDALFDATCKHQTAFQRPYIPNLDPESQMKGSLQFSSESGGLDRAGAGAIQLACDSLANRIQSRLPELFKLLDVESFPVPQVPLNILNGLDGHRGSPHADESGGRFEISLLYYFHRIPKAFRGGDLDFFNADPESPSGHGSEPIGRIDHDDNLLIAFPSHIFHCVTNVRCESNRFEDGRFAAIGFLGRQ